MSKVKKEIKIRTAKCKSSYMDNAVEPNQVMTVKQMLYAFTCGQNVPEKMSNGYDENPNIDEVGYAVGDRLEAVDYLNSVNQRISLAKRNAESVKAESAVVANNQTVVTDDTQKS